MLYWFLAKFATNIKVFIKHNNSKENKAWGTFSYVLTPILIFLTVISLIVLLGIGPFFDVISLANTLFSSTKTEYENTVFSGEIDPSLLTHAYAEIPDDAEIIFPYYGDAYASLHSPDVDIDCHVHWGDGMELLRKGAGQYCGSSPIGLPGNTVICAHVSKHFKNLKDLQVGNTVVLTTAYGKFTYTVRESFIFNENDLTYILKTENDILTLYTCHNYFLGPTPDRLAVICDLTQAIYYKAEE